MEVHTEACLFLSYGTSLADWGGQGILEAEIAVHRINDGLLIVAPDRTSPPLPKGAMVLLRPGWIPSFAYAFLSPLVHWRRLRKLQRFLGHNGRALWAPAIARAIFGGNLSLRFGYIWSWDAIQRGVCGIPLWVILVSEWWACRIADQVLVAAPWQASYLKHVHGVE